MYNYLVLLVKNYTILVSLGMVACACMSSPTNFSPDAIYDDTVVFSFPGQSLDEGTQYIEWTSLNDTRFQSLCFVGVDTTAPISLFVIQSPTIILAVQNDSCIEPQDSALDDIQLRSGSTYQLRVITENPVEFVFTLNGEL